MANKVSKLLVIDASVARSAGGEDATYPESVYCRDFLQAVLDTACPRFVRYTCRGECHSPLRITLITVPHNSGMCCICHRIAMTPDIRDEWNKHQSNFAKRWRRAMVTKKKLVFIEVPIDEQLWKKIEDSAESDRKRGTMVKDLLLLDAAIATDKTIISLDNEVRKLFKRAATEALELESIVWVNPGIPEEEVISWLENGANIESDRLLKNYLEPQ